jgi:hypothetical protein
MEQNMDFYQWIMGYILWETLLETEEEEENDQNDILNKPWVINTNIEIGQKTP